MAKNISEYVVRVVVGKLLRSFDHFPILKLEIDVPRQATSIGDYNKFQATAKMSSDPFDSALFVSPSHTYNYL
jgi:hypothetical protein